MTVLAHRLPHHGHLPVHMLLDGVQPWLAGAVLLGGIFQVALEAFQGTGQVPGKALTAQLSG